MSDCSKKGNNGDDGEIQFEDFEDDFLHEVIKQTDKASSTNQQIVTKFPLPIKSKAPHHIKVLSWNIDGLDERAVEKRAIGVVDCIQEHSPDVVLLQEVVDQNLWVLKQRCSKEYHFTVHRIAEYYNAIMVKKDESIQSSIVNQIVFENSEMGRYLLMQKLLVKGIPFTFMTTHLESLAESSQVRKAQLRQCFDEMEVQKFSSNVIFSGDLNIREKEVSALGGPPSDIKDAWVVCGSDKHKRFTWDCQLNDNKVFDGFKPRARYDRMFFCPKVDNSLTCENFDLLGTHKLSSCRLFPSDHFGMFVEFAF